MERWKPRDYLQDNFINVRFLPFRDINGIGYNTPEGGEIKYTLWFDVEME